MLACVMICVIVRVHVSSEVRSFHDRSHEVGVCDQMRACVCVYHEMCA